MEILQTEVEKDIISSAVRATSSLKGDIVEVGVYKGGTAFLVCQEKGDRKLHLFDTWKGIVSTSEEDKLTHSNFSIGRYSAELEPVKELLKEYNDVFFYQGEFPESYEKNIDKISLLHIDVDLYAPTRHALEIFWDKIERNGIIVLHDYPSFEGVRLAVDEALKGKDFIKVQTTKEQTIIIKVSGTNYAKHTRRII